MSGLSVEATAELVALLVEGLAPRVAAELAGSMSASAAGEPWRLLDLEEAASRLGRSERWVRERVKRGELPTVRLDGGALAFEVEDLRAFAAARRVALAENGAGREGRRPRAVERGWDG